jgi:hypothetical protein
MPSHHTQAGRLLKASELKEGTVVILVMPYMPDEIRMPDEIGMLEMMTWVVHVDPASVRTGAGPCGLPAAPQQRYGTNSNRIRSRLPERGSHLRAG